MVLIFQGHVPFISTGFVPVEISNEEGYLIDYTAIEIQNFCNRRPEIVPYLALVDFLHQKFF